MLLSTALVIVLLIIALVIVFVIRCHQRRIKHQHLTTAQMGSNAFSACEVDHDIGSISDKVSCGGSTRHLQSTVDNCSISCRPSPRLPAAAATRPASCSFANGNSSSTAKFDSPMTRTMDYGSAGDELENTGRQTDSQFPSYVRNADVAAKSPLMSPKNPLPPPGAIDNRQPSPRGLNNLNKAEFYRNKREWFVVPRFPWFFFPLKSRMSDFVCVWFQYRK